MLYRIVVGGPESRTLLQRSKTPHAGKGGAPPRLQLSVSSRSSNAIMARHVEWMFIFGMGASADL